MRQPYLIIGILLVLAIPSAYAGTPVATLDSPQSPVADNNATISRMFNITVNTSTANTTWKIDGVQVQYNSSQPVANYTNFTAGLGTYTVTATVNTTADGTGNTITWIWSVPSYPVTAFSVTTNLSTSTTSRVRASTNSTLNFSITAPGNVTFWNITFPAGFNFTALESANLTNNTGRTTITTTSTLLSIQNTTTQGLNNSVPVYFNLTGSIRTPSTAGTYTITITTNKDVTGTSALLYVRDDSMPFYVLANNSVFTVGAESFGALTTTIPLAGKGASNLTIFAPNITTQTNITVGWGATNATIIRSNRTDTQTVVFVEVNPSVSNPIIILSAPNEFTHGNLPAAIVATGLITGLTVVYAYLQRRRRH